MAVMWPEKAVGSSTVSFFCCNVGSISPLTGQPAVMAERWSAAEPVRRRSGTASTGWTPTCRNVGVMPTEVVETN